MQLGLAKSWLLALALVTGGVPSLAPAYAEAQPSRMKVTAANQDQFTLLDRGRPPVVCFQPSSEEFFLGTLNKRKLKRGARWKAVDELQLQEKINGLEEKIERLQQNKKKAKRRKRKRLKRTLRKNQKLLSRTLSYRSRCSKPFDGAFAGSADSLSPYREQLTEAEIDHILHKAAFGGNDALRSIAREEGLSALVTALVDGNASQQDLDRLDTEVNAWSAREFFFPEDTELYRGVRIWTTSAVQAGQMYRFIHSPNPTHEWMLLQLSAHFAVNLNRLDFSFNEYGHYGLPLHWTLLDAEKVGSLERLAQSLWTDPAMGVWLDNIDNHLGRPNENYPRELLELFLLGARDPVTGLPNYDERSIPGVTAFSSGYAEDEQRDPANGAPVIAVSYEEDLHDFGEYTIFHDTPEARFTGTLEPPELVTHILYQHPGAPRYLAERFAGQLLYPGLPESVVASLAGTLKRNDFEIKPLLRVILRSEAMFSERAVDSCVSSPLEYFVTLARTLSLPRSTPSASGEEPADYLYQALVYLAGNSGQMLFEPPSVFSWKGSCNVNRAGTISRGEGWLTTQQLLGRSLGCGELMNLLNWQEFDFLPAFGLNESASVDDAMRAISTTVTGRSFSSSQQNLIRPFFEFGYDNDEQEEFEIDVDFSREWIVRKKLPRVACFAADQEHFLRR